MRKREQEGKRKATAMEMEMDKAAAAAGGETGDWRDCAPWLWLCWGIIKYEDGIK